MDLSNPNTRQRAKELFSKAVEVIDRLGPLIKENGVLKRLNKTQEKVINDLRFDIGSLKAQIQTPRKPQVVSTHQKLISALSTKADALSKQADSELKLIKVSSENEILRNRLSELEDQSSKFFDMKDDLELLQTMKDRLLGQNELFKNKISGLESMLEEAADSVQECKSECEHARIKQFQNLKDCEESNDGLNRDIENLKIKLENGDILAEEKSVLIGEINRLRARDSSRRYNTVFKRFNRKKPTAPPSDQNFQ